MMMSEPFAARGLGRLMISARGVVPCGARRSRRCWQGSAWPPSPASCLLRPWQLGRRSSRSTTEAATCAPWPIQGQRTAGATRIRRARERPRPYRQPAVTLGRRCDTRRVVGEVSAGGDVHSCGVTTTGTAYCWGADSSGRLGNGAALTDPQESPSLVETPAGVTWVSVSAGLHHTCGLTTSGAAYCWGNNGSGAAGNGATANAVPSPSLVLGGPWATVDPGWNFTCGVTTTGAGYCWGSDASGSLGNGPADTANHPAPFPIDTPAGVTWTSITVGGESVCGVTTTGAAYCWGSDFNGGLGDGPALVDQHSPVPVDTPAGVVWATVDRQLRRHVRPHDDRQRLLLGHRQLPQPRKWKRGRPPDLARPDRRARWRDLVGDQP